MADVHGVTCARPDCSAPAVRRCYFCENTCCENHITVSNGAICFACSAKLQAERKERERAAAEARAAAQARSKGSGCLLTLLPLACILCAIRSRRRPKPLR